MHPLKASAQFAAAVSFNRGKANTPETREATRRFVKRNWIAFLPYAHEGWGRLLIRIAETAKQRKHTSVNGAPKAQRTSKVARQSMCVA